MSPPPEALEAPHVLVEADGGILWITFNRPEKRNALTPEAFVRLAEAWLRFCDDDDLRVAVVTGAGDRAFTAGGDLGRLIPLLSKARQPEDEWDERVLSDTGLMDVALLKTLQLYKPVVAAVNGWALAGGTELLQATDIRVASRTARFGLSEAKRGIVPGGGSLARLARQVPWCVAMEILLTGDDIAADEAWRIGLVNRVVEPHEVLPTARGYAETLAANGPLALRAIKEAVIRTSGVPLAEAFAVEAEVSAVVMASEDAKEGPRAFMEKRPAHFTGK